MQSLGNTEADSSRRYVDPELDRVYARYGDAYRARDTPHATAKGSDFSADPYRKREPIISRGVDASMNPYRARDGRYGRGAVTGAGPYRETDLVDKDLYYNNGGLDATQNPYGGRNDLYSFRGRDGVEDIAEALSARRQRKMRFDAGLVEREREVEQERLREEIREEMRMHEIERRLAMQSQVKGLFCAPALSVVVSSDTR